MTKLQMGIPTLLETKTLEECASLCNGLGLGFVELNMNLPQYQIEKMDADYFAAIAQKYDIYYTIHLDENMNVCDFNSKIAGAYVETVMQTIKFAKKLNIPILNMHLAKGVHFTLPVEKVYLFSVYEELYLQSLTDFRDQCEKAIGGSGIQIGIENTDGYDTPFLLKTLNTLLKSPVFAMTFDIGHNAGIGGGDETVILQHADRLCHMHMHDAIGSKNHLPLGTGELDLMKYFHLASHHHCRAVLEIKTIEALKQSMDWLNKNRYAWE